MTNKEIIDILEADVRRLMHSHAEAMEQIDRLQRANAGQAEALRSLQEAARRDKEEIARLRLGEALTGESSNRAVARAQVNRLLREVDKCIAIVSEKI